MSSNTIIRNDKVILIKELDDLKNVGAIYEVGNITEKTVIIRNPTTKVAVAGVNLGVFDEYFKKVEKFNGWTPWQKVIDPLDNVICFYRTNHKKVQVRTNHNIRSEACCCSLDEFDLYFGIRLAYARCRNKTLNAEIQNLKTKLNNLDFELKENKNIIKNMVDSLGRKA